MRAAEERQGVVRWLRPDFQQQKTGATQTALDIGEAAMPAASAKRARQPWPRTLPEQARAVRLALAAEAAPVTSAELASRFARARAATVEELLQTLASLGQAREVAGGRFVA